MRISRRTPLSVLCAFVALANHGITTTRTGRVRHRVLGYDSDCFANLSAGWSMYAAYRHRHC